MGIFIYITLAGTQRDWIMDLKKHSHRFLQSLFIWAQQTSLPYAGYKARDRLD